MPIQLSTRQAKQIRSNLMNSPVAPGNLSTLINVGTDRILDILQEQYFQGELAEGISCFKYLEGDYGTGKTQFIQCLAKRAHESQIVTSIVSIGLECPFSSPLSIFRNVMASFVPAPDDDTSPSEKGIEILFRQWIRSRQRQLGVTPGDAVPDNVKQEIERTFQIPWLGAPDPQMANGLTHLGLRLLALECGAQITVTDQELFAWIRGDSVTSKNLRESYGLHSSAKEESAFQRLKTAVCFLRDRLAFRGFFIAFDEGTRTMSFRRGSIKQKQAIENMLTMINQNAEGEFGGVMFLYAATPDFRSEVISRSYIALNDRIGSVAFTPGMPMTPLIKLDDQNSDKTLLDLGEKLLDVFEISSQIKLDRALQLDNIKTLVDAQKSTLFMLRVRPRDFVFHCCRMLNEQEREQIQMTAEKAASFVAANKIPDGDDN